MRIGVSVCIAGMLVACGCESPMDLQPGAQGVLQAFSPPSPSQAARWAVDDYDADNRARGTLMLANMSFAGEDVYLRLFRDNIRDPDANVRAVAAHGLGNHGGPANAHLLIEALGDDEEKVRLSASRALQRVHASEAIEALLRSTREEQEPAAAVRAEAAHALGQYRQSRVLLGLITALDDPDLVVNRYALHALQVMTGQDFGYDPRAWLDWFDEAPDAFAGGRVYTYPVFHRDRRLVEYLPFTPEPPNEVTSTPVGMPLPGIE